MALQNFLLFLILFVNFLINSFVKILAWNCNSIRPKILELCNLNQKENFDIICLSETKLNNSHSLNIPGYACYREDRNCNGGGVAIFVRSNFKHTETRILTLTSLEVIGIKLQAENKVCTIFSVYKPPRNKLNRSDLNTLFSHENCIIVGDLNCNNRAWNCHYTSSDGKLLNNYCIEKSIFIAAPSDPTFFPDDPKKRPSVIDLALFKDHSRFQNIFSSATLTSNHNPIVLILNLGPIATEDKFRFDFKKADWKSFSQYIDANFNIETLDSPADIDQAINTLTTLIQTSMQLNIQKSQIKFKNNLPSNKLIEFLVKAKNRYRKSYQNTRLTYFKKLQVLTSKLINKLLYILRNSYFNKKLSLIKTSDTLWQKKKSILPRSTYIPPLLSQLPDPNGSNPCYVYSAEEKSDVLAKHFESVHRQNLDMGSQYFTRRVDRAVVDFLSTETSDYLDQNCQVTTGELLRIIKFLKPNKSPGIDNIPALCIKNLSLSCVIKLRDIANQILKLGYFPTLWKTSKVIAIAKPAKSPHRADSYRPISLLCILSKIIEKVILTRFDLFLDREKLLADEQFGFRQNRSTVGQICRIADHIISNFNVKKHTGMILLDIEKCFDTVWHNGLIYKLITTNCPKYLIFIFHSYLTNRRLRVCIDSRNSGNASFVSVDQIMDFSSKALALGHSTLSAPKPIAAGVPQGSLVGPKLYIFFTHDAPKHKYALDAAFADDTAMFTSSWRIDTIVNRLQEYSKRYHKFFTKWKIKINPGKTEAILFTRRRPIVPPNIHVFKKDVTWKKQVKYLGVFLDSKLTYSAHMMYLKKKFYAALNSLYPIFNYKSKLSTSNKLLLYKSCLRPVITYACPAWNTICKTKAKNLQVLQNNALRIALSRRRNTKISKLHEEANIPYLYDFTSKLTQNFFNKLKKSNIQVLRKLLSYRIPRKIKYKRLLHNTIISS